MISYLALENVQLTKIYKGKLQAHKKYMQLLLMLKIQKKAHIKRHIALCKLFCNTLIILSYEL